MSDKRVVVLERDCTSFAMVGRNEKKFSCIRYGGVTKTWVGFGWLPTSPGKIDLVLDVVEEVGEGDIHIDDYLAGEMTRIGKKGDDDDFDEPLPAPQCNREGESCETCQ